MEILFLTSNLGNGHERAAKAVMQALAKSDVEHYSSTSLNLWSLMDEKVEHAIKHSYLRLAREYPDHYQRLYDLENSIWAQLMGKEPLEEPMREFLIQQQRYWFPELRSRVAGIGNNIDQTLVNSLVLCLCANSQVLPGRVLPHSLLLLMRGILLNRLREKISQIGPDVVVATQMYPAVLFARLKANGHFSTVPCLGIATDHGAQKLWADPHIDKYCVSNQRMGQHLQRWGVASSRIAVTGIPLMPEFQQVPNQTQARQALNIPANKNTVLIMGGQYGIGVIDAVSTILHGDNHYHLIVIACELGDQNKTLQDLANRHTDRITLFDWVDDMSCPLAAADVVVGKPGGLSVSEALACGRPFFAVCSLGGQEQHNVSFLGRNRVGGSIEVDQLIPALSDFFRTPSQRRELQKRALQCSVRQSADNIVGVIEDLTGYTDLTYQLESL